MQTYPALTLTAQKPTQKNLGTLLQKKRPFCQPMSCCVKITKRKKNAKMSKLTVLLDGVRN